jgi:hypothetical protein
MPYARLTRPNQTWALALDSAFANFSAPTLTELNDRRFVHFISCGLTEDGTNMDLADSETDDTLTFCSKGNEVTPTQYNVSAQLTGLKDANTGGAGSTVDLTSLYNKITAMLGNVDIPYWLISRTGPNASQDINFAAGHRIKMARFLTDYPTDVLENNTPVRGQNSLVFTGDVNWNFTLV